MTSDTVSLIIDRDLAFRIDFIMLALMGTVTALITVITR